MRHCFQSSTNSPLKQVMQKVLLKRKLSPHICKKSIFYCNYDTCLENNALIYVYKHSEHHLYEIVNVQEEDFECHAIDKLVCKFSETKNLN